jgi:hypothetical protein
MLGISRAKSSACPFGSCLEAKSENGQTFTDGEYLDSIASSVCQIDLSCVQDWW